MRILTVTADANLAVGLSLRCGDDVHVETVRGVADLASRAPARFDVALIALDNASRGVLAAGVIREHIDEIPCVIVANTPPTELPDGVTVLQPPFDLDAVTGELERAVRDAEVAEIRATAAAEAQGNSVPLERRQLDERTRAMRSDVATVWTREVARPEPSPDVASVEEPAAAADGAAAIDPGRVAGNGGDRAASREPGPVTAVTDEAPQGPDDVPEPTPDAELASEEGSGEAADPGHSGWSRRERLDRGLIAANELQHLVDGMPQLNDRHAIADALVHEVTAELDGSAAVLWGPDGTGGYDVLAWDGVPAAIVDRKASGSQPLLRDAVERHAVFLPPEERRPGYLDGLPGLHGGTVMAAALRADDEMHGVVVVSGGSHAEEDLIGVCALADEYAMALAIAAHLELIRHRPAVDLRDRFEGRRLG